MKKVNRSNRTKEEELEARLGESVRNIHIDRAHQDLIKEILRLVIKRGRNTLTR